MSKLSVKQRLLVARKRGKRNGTRDGLVMLAVLAVLFPTFVLASDLRTAGPGMATSLQALEHAPRADVSLSFGGDVILGRYVVAAAEGSNESLLGDAAPIFAASDIGAVNLETPILEDADPKDQTDKHIFFDAPPEMLEYIEDVDLVFTANNHAADYGQETIGQTNLHVEERGLIAVGGGNSLAEAYEPEFVDINGFRVGFVSFTDVLAPQVGVAAEHSGVATSNLKYLLPAVRRAARQSDFVIVNAHWGVEYQTSPTVRQRELAEALAGAGANLIIGNHPHVLQRAEMIDDTMVFYSLGNLVADQGWSDTRETVVPTVILSPQTGLATVYVEPFRIKEARVQSVEGGLSYRKNSAFSKILRRSNISFERDGSALVTTFYFPKVTNQ